MLRPVAIELPEVGAPLVPSRWRDINTMTIAYGHGLAVSPLHLADGVGAIVNGGIHRPATLLRQDPDKLPPGERAIAEETSRTMRELMRRVVVNGTGKKADAKGYEVGGKTGTADKQMGHGYRRDARLASFVGAFPVHDPRFVLLVMLDEPKGNAKTHNFATGGWVAAPVVARLIERLAPLAGIAPDPDDGRATKSGKPVMAISTRGSGASAGERVAAH
jgi:cell division protein FtsI (penicillin-binding protein 3)